jgi:hypothetical protein
MPQAHHILCQLLGKERKERKSGKKTQVPPSSQNTKIRISLPVALLQVINSSQFSDFFGYPEPY